MGPPHFFLLNKFGHLNPPVKYRGRICLAIFICGRYLAELLFFYPSEGSRAPTRGPPAPSPPRAGHIKIPSGPSTPTIVYNFIRNLFPGSSSNIHAKGSSKTRERTTGEGELYTDV